MEVILAKSAGFCFGVDRAVKIAHELAVSEKNPRMLGEVIHNSHMINDLAEQGMYVISSTEEAQADDCVLLRAHGEGENTYTQLLERGARIVDATCPKVARVQQLVRQAEQ